MCDRHYINFYLLASLKYRKRSPDFYSYNLFYYLFILIFGKKDIQIFGKRPDENSHKFSAPFLPPLHLAAYY